MVFFDVLLGHLVLGLGTQDSEGGHQEGGDAEPEQGHCEQQGVLEYAPPGVVLSLVDLGVGHSLPPLIEHVGADREHRRGVEEHINNPHGEEVDGVVADQLVLNAQGEQGPGDHRSHGKNFGHQERQHQVTKHEWGVEQHVPRVRHIRDPEGMPLGLPEPSLEVIAVPLPRRQRQLVEGHVDGHSHHLFILAFPEALLAGVEILPDGIGARVPPADALGHVVTDCVVGEREGEVDRHQVGQVDQAVHLIVQAVEDGHLQVVASVDLRGREEGSVPDLRALLQLDLELVEVLWGRPGVGVQDGQHHVGQVDHQTFGQLLLEVLHAPGNIGSLALGFALLDHVLSVVHVEEVFPGFAHQGFGFAVGSFFMGLHGQQNDEIVPCAGAFGQMAQCLQQHLLIFLITRNHDCMVEGVYFLNYPFIRERRSLVVNFIKLFDGGVEFEQGHQRTQGQPQSLQQRVDDNDEAVDLVGEGKEDGPQNHEQPAGDVDERNQEFPLVNALEVAGVHTWRLGSSGFFYIMSGKLSIVLWLGQKWNKIRLFSGIFYRLALFQILALYFLQYETP